MQDALSDMIFFPQKAVEQLIFIANLLQFCGKDVITRQNVTKWICEFKEGRMEVHGEERSGRPSVVSNAVL